VEVVVVVGGRRRVVVHAASLRAVRMKPCCYSDPGIQQLHNLPHDNISYNLFQSLLIKKKKPPFFSPFLEGKRSRKRERKEKKPFSSLFLEGERKWIS
jgi:hypothetical protein